MSQAVAFAPTNDCSVSVLTLGTTSDRMRQTSGGQSSRSPITPSSIATPTETGRVAVRAAPAARRNN